MLKNLPQKHFLKEFFFMWRKMKHLFGIFHLSKWKFQNEKNYLAELRELVNPAIQLKVGTLDLAEVV